MQTLTYLRGMPVEVKLNVSRAEHAKLVISSLCPSLSHLPAGDAGDKSGDCVVQNKHSSLQLDGCDIGHEFSRSFRKPLTKCSIEPWFPSS